MSCNISVFFSCYHTFRKCPERLAHFTGSLRCPNHFLNAFLKKFARCRGKENWREKVYISHAAQVLRSQSWRKLETTTISFLLYSQPSTLQNIIFSFVILLRITLRIIQCVTKIIFDKLSFDNSIHNPMLWTTEVSGKNDMMSSAWVE